MIMMRHCILCFLFSLACGRLSAGVDVELDVAFGDSTFRCKCLYVLRSGADGASDTLAVFDTLSFSRQNRISLFYTAPAGRENMISAVDSGGNVRTSSLFGISPQRTTFTVFIGPQNIRVSVRDYLYPLKNEHKESYFFFLLIFFAVKICLAIACIFVAKLSKRLIPVAAGTFLLSAFIDWLLPMNYIFRFLLVMTVEFLLITMGGRKHVSLLRAALLAPVVNVVGFGIIAAAYLFYVFWG